MKKSVITGLLLIILFPGISCRQMWGDNDLGSNILLLEGDTVEDRVIVYCSGRSFGACVSGIPIVPVYKRQFDSTGHYAEYVETATSNKKWIIARSLQIAVRKKNYWIIKKGFSADNYDSDSIIQSHVMGPFGLSEFQSKAKELSIDLKFDK